ncbi:phycobiliprotein lyase [Pseudanabaena sp. FACHB-1998]|uniref:phycobiliprotein lyase n=1 Tax=Pseudanabaena sp. FACHB-1998 TaxID=2692858 RepID=UPI0016803410|nr:phycobiliprotein lyase [Pseudanabaena sp. FACHB-1998]MBD2177098.1 phycobiliprotein lyase [Pseudanabaena sp. FACHB-1998]
MDIHQFLELFVGRWRSQRSDHQFSKGNGSDTRSLIEITPLSLDDPNLIAICQKHNLDPLKAIQPMQMSWEEESLSSKKPSGVSFIVPIPHEATELKKGLILTSQSKGEYELAEDESLTIRTVVDQGSLEERIWYGNPNLRFRVATLIHKDQSSDRHVQSSKFYSEIRISPAKPSA